MVTTEQIKALEERQQALYTHLHIEDRRLELDEQGGTDPRSQFLG